jgi:hypothetical protein
MTKVTDEASLALLQGNQGMKGSEDAIRQTMAAENLSLSEAAAQRGNGRELVGTAGMIADPTTRR